MTQRFRVAILSAESVPFAKVGGLADVVGALSKSIADLGCAVAVFLQNAGAGGSGEATRIAGDIMKTVITERGLK